MLVYRKQINCSVLFVLLFEQVKELASWIKLGGDLVVITGAGISTSAGIPDFRGPKGIFLCSSFTSSNARLTPRYIPFFTFVFYQCRCLDVREDGYKAKV